MDKRSFIRGMQCPKILWMDSYMADKADNTEENEETVMPEGYEAEALAKSFFPAEDGVTTSFNVNISSDELMAHVDILRDFGDHVDIVEVRCAVKVSDLCLYEMAYQMYVLTKCGKNVAHVYNLHLDKDYVRTGDIDVSGLFELKDCTEDVTNRLPNIKAALRNIRKTMLSKKEPVKDISEACFEPGNCPYWGYCSRSLEKPNVFDVHGMQRKKQFELISEGVVTFNDMIPRKNDIPESQYRQVDFEVNKKPAEVDKKAVNRFLKTVTYPLYYLDFEAYTKAIPEFDGVSPFTQIPFQYSLHVQKVKGGPTEHFEFLAEEGRDPRKDLAKQLVNDIPEDVCVLAYNSTFEKSVISKLASQFPEFSVHLMNIHSHIQDLELPFRNHSYYCREMAGSFSLKSVLPALCPDDPKLDYNALRGVHNGAEASATFADLKNHTPEEIKNIRAGLLKYCGLDTYAMVKIIEKLYAAVKA